MANPNENYHHAFFLTINFAQTVGEPVSLYMLLYTVYGEQPEKRDCAADVDVDVIYWSQWICFLTVKQKEECTKKIRELGSLPADAFEKHQKTPIKTVSWKSLPKKSCFVYCVRAIFHTVERFFFIKLHNWRKENSRHFFIQSEVNLKPNVTRSHSFSRPSRQLHVFTSSFDWFTLLSVSCDWLECLLRFGLTTHS